MKNYKLCIKWLKHIVKALFIKCTTTIIDMVKKDKELWSNYKVALVFYWLFIYISLFIIPLWIESNLGQRFFYKLVFWLLFFVGLWIIRFIDNKRSWSLVLKTFFLLACLFLTMIFMPMLPGKEKFLGYMGYPRSLVSYISIAVFIFLYEFIIYEQGELELSEDNHYIELVHKRYLEYLHSFIWISVFAFLTVATIYVNWISKIESLALPQEYPRIIWLFHLCISYFLGVLLVFFAFHLAINKVEKKLLNLKPPNK